jgi:hypothetical protein
MTDPISKDPTIKTPITGGQGSKEKEVQKSSVFSAVFKRSAGKETDPNAQYQKTGEEMKSKAQVKISEPKQVKKINDVAGKTKITQHNQSSYVPPLIHKRVGKDVYEQKTDQKGEAMFDENNDPIFHEKPMEKQLTKEEAMAMADTARDRYDSTVSDVSSRSNTPVEETKSGEGGYKEGNLLNLD